MIAHAQKERYDGATLLKPDHFAQSLEHCWRKQPNNRVHENEQLFDQPVKAQLPPSDSERLGQAGAF